MNYKNVKTFDEFLSPRSAEVVELQARRNQAARSLEDRKQSNTVATKKTQIKPVIGMEGALARSERDLMESVTRLRKVQDLQMPTWALVRVLMEAEETLWTPDEIPLWYKPLGRNEGPGEAALRIRLGIASDATYKPGDLIKYGPDGTRLIYREVKSVDIVSSIEHHNERESIQSIQTGSQGRHAFGRWSWALTDAQKATIDPELADFVAIGEITQARIPRLPTELLASIKVACAPSKSMGTYEGVYATTRHGFIFIPQAACDQAWELELVTKMGPKYVLSDEYLRHRIRASAEQVS